MKKTLYIEALTKELDEVNVKASNTLDVTLCRGEECTTITFREAMALMSELSRIIGEISADMEMDV